jgi:hypothetical protein
VFTLIDKISHGKYILTLINFKCIAELSFEITESGERNGQLKGEIEVAIGYDFLLSVGFIKPSRS